MKLIPIRRRSTFALIATLVLAGCGGQEFHARSAHDPGCEVVSDSEAVVFGSGLPGDPAAPEPASGYRSGKVSVAARDFMVVSANPLATRAGCKVLGAGGSAVDAAIAVQMVLGLVEPQSSGLGGGGFMLHYDARARQVQAYDGRETAPATVDENYLGQISATDRRTPQPNLRASGRSIGTPGLVRMLEMAHRDHGRLPWESLFDESMALARNGFPIGGRMADALSASATGLTRDADAAALFLNADGSAKTLGTWLVNHAYAETLSRLARQGGDAFYSGQIAQSIVDKVGATRATDGATLTPGSMTLADLASYEARRRQPVCTTYRVFWVCGMPPPSSGGIAVAATLGILENFPLGRYRPTHIDAEGGRPHLTAVHLISESQRLAYADRDKYVADTDFVPLPGGDWTALLDKDYLAGRAARIDMTRSMGVAEAGRFDMPFLAASATLENGTTHVSIVDQYGNAVVLTSSIEASMGAYRLASGFLLNNQLTDFSVAARDEDGRLFVNHIAPGKRPRSSMAPTLIFHMADDGTMGALFMATGSPGGSAIIQYVVKSIVAAVDWDLDAQQSVSLVNFGAANTPTTNIGGEHPNVAAAEDGSRDPLITGLRQLGHAVSLRAQPSGLAAIIRENTSSGPRLTGGADPRREGLALGGRGSEKAASPAGPGVSSSARTPVSASP